MKKTMIFTSCLFLVVLFFSCAEDFQRPYYETDELDQSFSTKVTFSPLLSNPYDALGEYHNKALDVIFEKLNTEPQVRSKSGSGDVEKVITNLVKDYMLSNNICDVVAADREFSNLKPVMKEFAVKPELITWQSKIRSKGGDNIGLSLVQKKYYDDITALLYSKKINSPQDLINRINKVEVNISNSTELSEIEQAQLLIASAVAKYSSIYWINYWQQNTSIIGGIRTRSSDDESSNGFWDWWTNVASPNISSIIESDFKGAAAGAALGALTGAGAGSVVPGAGTVTVGIAGGVVGGASGAIGSSAYEGVSIIFQ